MSDYKVTVSKTAFPLSMTYVFYAEPQRVFDAFTQKEIVATWCDGGGFMEPVTQGNLEFFNGWVKGNVLAADRSKGVLEFTWRPTEWDRKVQDSFVHIMLKPHPAGTEIQLEHGGFPSMEESDKHYAGWMDYVFEPMNDMFTGISPLAD